jgi:hypothetical protein
LNENPVRKPDQYGLISLLAVSYCDAFQPMIVCHNVAKTGLFPFERETIFDDAIAPHVTERKELRGWNHLKRRRELQNLY